MIILTNFILPGILNQMTRMTEVPSALVAQDFSSAYSESEIDITHRDIGVLLHGQRKSITASLEYIGILPPEQLKFGQ